MLLRYDERNPHDSVNSVTARESMGVNSTSQKTHTVRRIKKNDGECYEIQLKSETNMGILYPSSDMNIHELII